MKKELLRDGDEWAMNDLNPCPFCGGEAMMRLGEFQAKSCTHKKEIPKGARLIRKSTYPSGATYYEYRQKAFIPQCLNSKCLGRVHRLFETAEEATEAWNRRVGEADVAPVRYGRWIEDDDGDGRHCSECGTDYCYVMCDAENYNFCPNCGARCDLEG